MTPPATDPPPFATRFWLLFSLDHPPADAQARFAARFQVPPAFCLPRANGWWVGPLPAVRP